MSDKNEPRRVPAKKPGQATPAGQAKPADQGQSMKERLLAQRRAAEAAGQGGTSKPAGQKPAAAPKAAPASKASAARPAGASRAARASAAGGEGGGRRRHHPEPKKKSPVPLIATGLVVVAAGVGGWYVMQMGKTDETVAAKGTEGGAPSDASAADPSAASGDGATTPEGGGEAAAPSDSPQPAEAPKPATAEDREAAAAKAAEVREATGQLPGPKDADAWNVIAITKNPDQVNDPNSVDLAKLVPYGKPPGVDDATWAALQDDAKTFFDPLAGAKAGRAERRLEEAGLNAWPAVMNEFIKINPAIPDDNVVGMNAQRLLDRIRGGDPNQNTRAFDWRTPAQSGGELERKDLYYNKATMVELFDVWRRHLAAPDRYFREKIAKGKLKEDLDKAAEGGGGGDLGGVDLDNLDLGGLGG